MSVGVNPEVDLEPRSPWRSGRGGLHFRWQISRSLGCSLCSEDVLTIEGLRIPPPKSVYVKLVSNSCLKTNLHITTL